MQPRRLDAQPDTEPCGSYWSVVQTHPQAERWAQANLERQGYQTLLPLMRAKRRDRVIRSAWHTVEVPLFASYLLVTIDRHWTPIKSTLGVRKLLLDGDGKPGRVARAVVSALQAVRDFAAPGDAWMPGTPCSLTACPFSGHDAVVTQMHDDQQHATVALMMLGQMRQVYLHVDCLCPRE